MSDNIEQSSFSLTLQVSGLFHYLSLIVNSGDVIK